MWGGGDDLIMKQEVNDLGHIWDIWDLLPEVINALEELGMELQSTQKLPGATPFSPVGIASLIYETCKGAGMGNVGGQVASVY